MAKQAQQQQQSSHLWASSQAWHQQIKPAAGLAGTSPHDDYDVDNDDDDDHEDQDDGYDDNDVNDSSQGLLPS